MSRSGNHAVINWLLAHLEGQFCFLNCVEPKQNPYQSSRPMGSGLSYETNIPQLNLQAERLGEFSRKDYLLYSYEDCFLGLLRKAAVEFRHDEWLGASAERQDLLILRDPFNLFASRVHFGLNHIPHARAMKIWKQHAREALGIRRFLPSSRRVILFNSWVTCSDYRRQIAEQLGLRFTDAAINDVADTAGGSSFDGLKHHGNASHMRVLDRWQEFAEDDGYWQLFDDELIELSTELFGPPPTRAQSVERPLSEVL